MDDSVFFHTWHALPQVPDAASLLAKWDRLRELRDPVRKQIEELRVGNRVGSSLQADAEIRADGEDYDLLASLGAGAWLFDATRGWRALAEAA